MTGHGDIKGTPPSAKLVYKVLEREGELTQQELADCSRLSKRAVRDALARLREENLLRERSCVHDANRSTYSVRKRTEQNTTV